MPRPPLLSARGDSARGGFIIRTALLQEAPGFWQGTAGRKEEWQAVAAEEPQSFEETPPGSDIELEPSQAQRPFDGQPRSNLWRAVLFSAFAAAVATVFLVGGRGSSPPRRGDEVSGGLRARSAHVEQSGAHISRGAVHANTILSINPSSTSRPPSRSVTGSPPGWYCDRLPDQFPVSQGVVGACGSPKCDWIAAHGCSMFKDGCCCKEGFASLATGPIRSGSHPELCLTACGHHGLPYRAGAVPPIAMAPCEDGVATRFTLNTSEHFMRIHWAHSSSGCLSLLDESLVLRQCEPPGVPPAETQFWFQDVSRGAGLIHWARTPNKCLSVVGWPPESQASSSSAIRLEDCNVERPDQIFSLPRSPLQQYEESPSLFCTALIQPKGYELGLVQAQWYRGRAGIFGCDEWAVYSNESMFLVKGPPDHYTDIMPGDLSCPYGGKYHSALNTGIFIRFWAAIVKDKRAWRNDWVAKLDADCVFFASRLRPLLRHKWFPHGKPGGSVWLNNCFLGSHGPIEVLSREALEAFRDRHQECEFLRDTAQQEDVFLRQCLRHLGSQQVNMYNVLYESAWACTEPPTLGCATPQVAFHPFKSVDAWFSCHDVAKQQNLPAPFIPFDRAPDKRFGYSEDPKALPRW